MSGTETLHVIFSNISFAGAVGGNVPGGNVIPGGAKQLFLSYGHEDNVNRFAKQLKQDLEERGFTVWMDVGIPAGTANLRDGMVSK